MKLNFHSQKSVYTSYKQNFKKLGMLVFFISLSSVKATTSFSLSGCNTSFKGIVKSVSSAPLSSASKLNIKIKVEEVFRGDVSPEFSTTMVQTSSKRLKEGDRVSVVAHNGLICSIN